MFWSHERFSTHAAGTYYGQQGGQNDGGACSFGKAFSNSLVKSHPQTICRLANTRQVHHMHERSECAEVCQAQSNNLPWHPAACINTCLAVHHFSSSHARNCTVCRLIIGSALDRDYPGRLACRPTLLSTTPSTTTPRHAASASCTAAWAPGSACSPFPLTGNMAWSTMCKYPSPHLHHVETLSALQKMCAGPSLQARL